MANAQVFIMVTNFVLSVRKIFLQITTALTHFLSLEGRLLSPFSLSFCLLLENTICQQYGVYALGLVSCFLSPCSSSG